MTNHFLLEWDKEALLWINSHHHPLLDAILAPVSYAGEVAAVWIAVCLALLVFARPEHKRTAILLILTIVITNFLIAHQLAHWFHRARPYETLDGVRQIGIRWVGSSFPSGHAHSVWIATVILACRWRALLWPLVAFAVLTCYSRPYFGMHYPLDVIAGSALGILAAYAALRIERFSSRRAKKRTPLPTLNRDAGRR